MPVERNSVLSGRADSSTSRQFLDSARTWFREYLCRPHEQLGRDGYVCPFVLPADLAGTIRFEVVTVDPDLHLDGGRLLVEDMVDTFAATRWQHSNRQLHTLVSVLDGLPVDRFGLLDVLHATVKRDIVVRGLMLGQFHPHCPEPAVRNPSFPVSRSPVPMLVLRHMAVHDVLFLQDDEACFRAYDTRFGHRYEQRTTLDPLFVELFWRARERFGQGVGS